MQLTDKLFHDISNLNIQRMYTILFSSSSELYSVVNIMPTAVLGVHILSGVDNIHMVTCGTYHIFC